MEWVTPTGLGERAYHNMEAARLQRAAKYVDRPDWLPEARRVYRPTIEAKALGQLARAAYDAAEAAALPEGERDRAAAAVQADLDRRFPAADMEILARYGFAVMVSEACIVMAVSPTLWLPLKARLLPAAAAVFAGEACAIDDRTPPVPEGAQTYFDHVAHWRPLRRDMRFALSSWPGQFKCKHDRWPRWEEIEAAWPILGDYLRERRGGGGMTSAPDIQMRQMARLLSPPMRKLLADLRPRPEGLHGARKRPGGMDTVWALWRRGFVANTPFTAAPAAFEQGGGVYVRLTDLGLQLHRHLAAVPA